MNRQQPVKVLAIVRRMERGGMESRLMDILRAVDAHRVSIDIYACSPEPTPGAGRLKKRWI